MLNTQTMLLMMLFLIVVLGMWQSRRMKNFISVSYTSETNQAWDKVVKAKNGVAIFEGRKFYLMPEYGVSKQFTKGLSSLFPTKITHYDFVWNSPYPVDHKTGKPAMLSPEVENALDQRGTILAAYQTTGQGAISTMKGKGGFFEKLMPILVIVAVLGVAYLVWNNMQTSKNNKVTQQAIIDIYNTFNHMGQPVIPATPVK